MSMKTITKFAIFLALSAALVVPFPAGAAGAGEINGVEEEPVHAREFTVSRVGDLEKSCEGLLQESALMNDIIATTQDIKDTAENQSHGVTAAGAVGSLLIGTMTGGIGLAVGGLLLDHNIDAKAENADQVQDIAEQRRSLMTGIYVAKGCPPLPPPEATKNAANDADIYGPPNYADANSLATLEASAGGGPDVEVKRYNN